MSREFEGVASGSTEAGEEKPEKLGEHFIANAEEKADVPGGHLSNDIVFPSAPLKRKEDEEAVEEEEDTHLERLEDTSSQTSVPGSSRGGAIGNEKKEADADASKEHRIQGNNRG